MITSNRVVALVPPLLEGEGWGEVWDISEKVTHLTLSLSFQERGPAPSPDVLHRTNPETSIATRKGPDGMPSGPFRVRGGATKKGRHPCEQHPFPGDNLLSNYRLVEGVDLGGLVAGDFHADADFLDDGGGPLHGVSPEIEVGWLARTSRGTPIP